MNADIKVPVNVQDAVNSEGKCVKLWTNGCDIYRCCEEHNAYFCGICCEFPCNWIVSKISEWDKNGIKKLESLRDEYHKMKSYAEK